MHYRRELFTLLAAVMRLDKRTDVTTSPPGGRPCSCWSRNHIYRASSNCDHQIRRRVLPSDSRGTATAIANAFVALRTVTDEHIIQQERQHLRRFPFDVFSRCDRILTSDGQRDKRRDRQI